MSLYSRLRGITGSLLQLGGPSGPNLKANSGALEARNAADGAYAVTRGADPSASNDLVTLGYFNSNVFALPAPYTTVGLSNQPGNGTFSNVTSANAFGNRFYVLQNATCTGARFVWKVGATPPDTLSVKLWNVSGNVALDTQSKVVSVDGTYTVTWTSPITLTAWKYYVVSFLVTAGSTTYMTKFAKGGGDFNQLTQPFVGGQSFVWDTFGLSAGGGGNTLPNTTSGLVVPIDPIITGIAP